MKSKYSDEIFYFYYLRQLDNTPYACICLQRDQDNKWSRGISACYFSDKFVKKEARKIAKGRCLKALYTKNNNDLIKRGDPPMGDICSTFNDYNSLYKSGYNVSLSTIEKEIVYNHKDMVTCDIEPIITTR